MADLLCEVYEVCYGTGPADPAPQVVSLSYRTQDAARIAANALNAQARSGDFDPAMTAADKAFFVRVRPGQDLLPVPTSAAGQPPTAGEIKTALAATELSVPVFVRTLNPSGYVRVAVLPRSLLVPPTP